MKTLLSVIALLTVCTSLFAQRVDTVRNVVYYTLDEYTKKINADEGTLGAYGSHDNLAGPAEFYGIDFSLLHIVGEYRTDQEFVNVFDGINQLFLSESSKYNIEKYIHACAGGKLDYDLDIVAANNDKHRKFLKTKPLATEKSVSELVADYKIDTDNKIGIVIVADYWNKGTQTGRYYIVKFDTKSRQILFMKRVSGKTGGFGLRNYWANTVYESLKKYRKLYRQ